MLGSTVGYLYGSYALQKYVATSVHPTITSDDPRWIGAWWHGKAALSQITNFGTINISIYLSSSSSSSALQPGVGFGFSSLLEGYVTMIVLQGGVVNPTPNPQLFWRTNVFSQGCLP
jgi:hypothetical protein